MVFLFYIIYRTLLTTSASGGPFTRSFWPSSQLGGVTQVLQPASLPYSHMSKVLSAFTVRIWLSSCGMLLSSHNKWSGISIICHPYILSCIYIFPWCVGGHCRYILLYQHAAGIPYSEHSSYNELRGCVQGLRPLKIIPTVNNFSAQKREEMQRTFRKWLSEQDKKLLVQTKLTCSLSLGKVKK